MGVPASTGASSGDGPLAADTAGPAEALGPDTLYSFLLSTFYFVLRARYAIRHPHTPMQSCYLITVS